MRSQNLGYSLSLPNVSKYVADFEIIMHNDNAIFTPVFERYGTDTVVLILQTFALILKASFK